jgi:4-amino-4-deoxy-L-arabinose transferase-like glycosyltransferase
MTSGAASLPARRTLAAVAGREAVAVAAVAGVAIGLLAATWETWGNIGQDTGYDLVAGHLVAHGSVPYSDFTYYYGPLSPAVLGLAERIGGPGIWPAIAVGVALAAAIVAATYVLARRLAGTAGAVLAATITAAVAFAPTNFSFVDPHSYSETLGVLAVLGFLIALARRTDGGGRGWLIAAGAGAGLVLLTRPELAAAVALAGVAWTACGRLRRTEILLLAAPAAAIALLVYGPLAARAGLHRLLFENLYPVDQLRAAGDHVLRIQAPLTPHSFLELGLRCVIFAALVALVAGVGRALDEPRLRAAAAGAIALAAAGLLLTLALRTDTVTYYLLYPYAWIPLGAVAAVWLFARRARRGGADDRLALAVAVVLAVLAAKTYAAFYPFSSTPQSAAYATPFAAILLARLHLVELGRRPGMRVAGAAWLAALAVAGAWVTVAAARTHTVAVAGPGGTIRAAAPAGHVYAGALRWIDRETRPGEPVLLAPQLTALYALSERTDPVAQISLLPGTLPTVRAQRAEIAALRASGVRLAVTDRRQFTEYGHTRFGESFDRTLAAWLHRSFVHVATLTAPGPDGRTLDVWIKGARK